MMTIYARVRGLRRRMHAGAGAHAAPVVVLGAPGHADPEHHRPAADRGAAQRGRRARRSRARALPGHPPARLRSRACGSRSTLLDARRRPDSSWSDALASSQGDVQPVSSTATRACCMERRQRVVAAAPHEVFERLHRAWAATRGWPFVDWAWRLRGVIDRLAGGRRHAARPPRPADAATPATRSTSGGSKRSSPAGCCASAPR